MLSTAIAFTGGNLVVTIPEGSYNNGEKYCIVLAQSIPNTTTITAPTTILHEWRYMESAVCSITR